MLSISLDGIIFSLQNFGGISVYYKELLESLQRNKINTALYTFNAKNSYVDLSNYSNLKFPYRFCERFRNFPISNLGNSIFHSSYYRIPSKINNPIVVTVYDFISEKFSSIKSKLFLHQKRKAISVANSIICISDTTRDDLHYYCKIRSDQKIYTIPCGVSSKFFSDGLNSLNYKNYFVYVGNRLSPYKNFHIALNLLKKNPFIKLYCVGGGPFKRHELSSLSYSEVNRISHFLHPTEDMLAQIYRSAICLVYPSKYEGFGIPVIEALRSGCPVIVGPCKTILDFCGAAVIKADSFKIDAFDFALKIAVSDARYAYIELGKKLSYDLTWNKIHNDTLDVYRELMK